MGEIDHVFGFENVLDHEHKLTGRLIIGASRPIRERFSAFGWCQDAHGRHMAFGALRNVDLTRVVRTDLSAKSVMHRNDPKIDRRG